MAQTTAEIKARYFKKLVDNASTIRCGCGCGTEMKAVDNYGRPKAFITGHNNRKYDDPGQYKREWNHRNRASRYELKKQRCRKLKRKLIQQFGGRCQRADCGLVYNGKNAAAFHFHHVDPSTKSFALGNKLHSKAWQAILDEATKCEMICANCHELSHSGAF
jgi:hypothetical protein